MVVHRAAAIDCGTNAIRLLILDVDPGSGRAVDVVRELRIVRLGEGVDRTGEFAAAALERTFAACREYADLLARAGHPPLRFVATAAARDARNRAVFAEGALPEQTKQLIAVAVAHTTQCPFCIKGHTRLARRKGATDEQIMEAIWVAAEMRAGGAYAHSTLALDVLAK